MRDSRVPESRSAYASARGRTPWRAPCIGDMGVLELYSDSGFHGQVLDRAIGRVGSRAFPRGNGSTFWRLARMPVARRRGSESVDVPGGSSGAWGRLLEELVRRPRSLVSRRSRSRYFRSEDGHPSPSPDRKCMNYGPERAHMIRRTFQVDSVRRTRRSAGAWRSTHDGADLIRGFCPHRSVAFRAQRLVDGAEVLVDAEPSQALRDGLVADAYRARDRSVAHPEFAEVRRLGSNLRNAGAEPASMIVTTTGIEAAVRILCVRVHFRLPLSSAAVLAGRVDWKGLPDMRVLGSLTQARAFWQLVRANCQRNLVAPRPEGRAGNGRLHFRQ